MTQQKTIQRDLKKLQQNKQFLTILILLFVVLLFWVTISLITSQTTEKISPELQKLSKPLTPVIDENIFEKISAKRQYTEEELSGFTIFKVLVSKDGRTERVVPIEVTADELEPETTPRPRTGGSLLQEENQGLGQQTTEPTLQPTIQPTTGGSSLSKQL